MTEQAPMPVTSHLRELRSRLRNIAIIIFVVTIISFIFQDRLFYYMAIPYYKTCQALQSTQCSTLVFTNMTEGFMVLLKASFLAAIFASAPFVFYQLWRFIAPALHLREKKWGFWGIVVATLLFIAGGAFSYFFVLPASCEFFLSSTSKLNNILHLHFSSANIQPMITLEEYFGFAWMLLVIFGLVFEVPLLLVIISLTGLISPRALWRFNRYAILIFAILGAVVTPGDLVVGQIIMTIALTILYNASILLVWSLNRVKKKSQ